MKRVILCIIGLTALDQVVKLLVTRFLIDSRFAILPSVLYFRPHQNTHLGFFPSLFDFVMPVYYSVLITILVGLFLTICYRYMKFMTFGWNKYKCLPLMYLVLTLSACICSFIDNVAWGGSWDFIYLVNWFIFDFKDAYLAIGIVSMVFYAAAYGVLYERKLSKEERKEASKSKKLLSWVKRGLPLRPDMMTNTTN